MSSLTNHLFRLSICLVTFFTFNVGATSFNLAALPYDQKKSICDKNLAFCERTCSQGVLVNSCDSENMSFECDCVGNLPVSHLYFPINAQQCVGETQDCRNACFFEFTSNTDKVATCSNTCDAEMACGTAKSTQKKQFFVNSNSTSSSTSEPTSTKFSSTSSQTPLSTTFVKGEVNGVSNEGHALSSYLPFLLILFLCIIW